MKAIFSHFSASILCLRIFFTAWVKYTFCRLQVGGIYIRERRVKIDNSYYMYG